MLFKISILVILKPLYDVTLYLLKLIFIEEFGHFLLFEMVNFAFISANVCYYNFMLMSQIITETMF